MELSPTEMLLIMSVLVYMLLSISQCLSVDLSLPLSFLHTSPPSFPHSMVGTETEQQEARSKLSLRRLFSAIGLNGVGKLGKGRSSSMEQLSFQPRGLPPASPGPTSTPGPSLGTPKCPDPSQLRKAPSLQSLRMVREDLPLSCQTYLLNYREFYGFEPFL